MRFSEVLRLDMKIEKDVLNLNQDFLLLNLYKLLIKKSTYETWSFNQWRKRQFVRYV